MKAYLNDSELPLNQIGLDELGWDDSHEIGNTVISLELDKDELKIIGESVYDESILAIKEEREYLDEVDSTLIPTNSKIFSESPALLARYMASEVWKGFLIEVIMILMKGESGEKQSTTGSLYLIRNFVSMQPKNNDWILEFGTVKV
ncbi:MAG TPA: hypothetical protein VNZ45_08470 [Bacteroidia bacterium]|jgi:hypothetical protein|nr:hypothetical protein [Bacteroidia bacterium]